MSTVATLPPAAPNTPPHADPGPRRWRCTREQYAKLRAAGFFTERRYQLIRGEVIDMGKEKEGPRHFAMMMIVAKVLETAFGPGCTVRPGGPIGFEDSEPEPDVAVVPGVMRDYIAQHPATALLAVEVAETSLQYDQTEKAELYASAGIPEYWVIDLNGREVIVFRDPAPLAPALGATAYQSRQTFTAGQTIQPLHAPNAVAVADLLP
ncbi:MAG: Uma2 family endonuclease [Gemmataceae bacterium]|nr:Uma2 family endonuclease [Gemmataceae bacterium]